MTSFISRLTSEKKYFVGIIVFVVLTALFFVIIPRISDASACGFFDTCVCNDVNGVTACGGSEETGGSGGGSGSGVGSSPDLYTSPVSDTSFFVNEPVTLSWNEITKVYFGTEASWPNGSQSQTGIVRIDNNALHEITSSSECFTDPIAGEICVTPPPTPDYQVIDDGVPILVPVGESRARSVSYTFPTVGTWYVQTCAKEHSNEIHTSNNCSSWTAVYITAPSTPDLSAETAGIGNSVVGQPVNLTGTVQNSGDATATDVQNVFQINGIGYIAAQTHTLNAGANGALSASYTFSTPGTYSVRACSDTNTSGSGGISESNESNNCGSWRPVVISWPAFSLSCNASDSDALVGESVIWSVSASGGSGSYTYAWSGTDGLSGSASSVSKTYASEGTKNASVTVTSASGTLTQSCSSSIAVTSDPDVDDPDDPDPDDPDSPDPDNPDNPDTPDPDNPDTPDPETPDPEDPDVDDPDTDDPDTPDPSTPPDLVINILDSATLNTTSLVKKGNTVTIEWSIVGTADSCSVTGTNGDSWSGPSGTQQSSAITGETTFTLRCIAGSNQVSVSKTVRVVPGLEEQ